MSLTRQEFRVLQELLTANERWSTTKRLTEVAAGERRAGVTPVAVHIHALRKKLKEEAWRLRSHRGLGYLFDASQPELHSAFTPGDGDDKWAKK